MQERALLEVQLDALRASSDISQAEAQEEAEALRKKVNEFQSQRDALARANAITQQQNNVLLATRGHERLEHVHSGSVLQNQV